MADDPKDTNTPPANPPANPPATPPANPPKDDKPDLTWEEKVKGKSYEEVVKMYGEVQHKMGEMSGELGTTRKQMEQAAVVFTAIGSSPEKEKMVRGWVEELSKDKGEDKSKDKDAGAESSEVRQAMVTDKMREFEVEFGLDKLPIDKKKEEGGRLANALWEMADPEGKYKNWDDLVGHIPVAKLPRMLRNAWFLSHQDDILDKVKAKQEADRRENDGAAIPGFSSSSIDERNDELSAAELKAAKKMNISPEKYLERKREIAKSK